MSATFEHISLFENATPETQLRSMVEFILENPLLSDQEIHKLEWRIQKFAAKLNVPYHKAAEIIREEVRRIIEARLEKVL